MTSPGSNLPTDYSAPTSAKAEHHHWPWLEKRIHRFRVDTAREQLLFGGARVKRHAAEREVSRLRHHDEAQDSKIRSLCEGGSSTYDTCNPSQEAAERTKLDENHFGDDDQISGWPGIGVWPAPHQEERPVESLAKRNSTATVDSDKKTPSTEEGGEDGWPGLGFWPSSKT